MTKTKEDDDRMGTMTRDDLKERLRELKRSGVPRCSAERLPPMDPPEAWAALLEQPALHTMIDSYLRGYVAPGAENSCPCCGGRWSSRWGLVWGAVECSCGWPGRFCHRVKDTRTDDALVCSAACNGYRVCTATRGEHKQIMGTEALRCPSPIVPPGLRPEYFTSDYRPPEIAAFDMLLWAHPYTVHLTSRRT